MTLSIFNVSASARKKAAYLAAEALRPCDNGVAVSSLPFWPWVYAFDGVEAALLREDLGKRCARQAGLERCCFALREAAAILSFVTSLTPQARRSP